jgi:hypothetical protein
MIRRFAIYPHALEKKQERREPPEKRLHHRGTEAKSPEIGENCSPLASVPLW